MGQRRLLGALPDGTREYHEYDEGTDTTLIHFESPELGPHLDRNKALYNDPDQTWTEHKDMRLVASIPPAVQLKWLQTYGVRAWDKAHKGAVARLLNDPEWRHLRTAPGRIRT